MNYDEKCQLLIIGEASVGKTSLLSKFTNPKEEFNDKYLATVGLDFFTKDIKLLGKILRIKIWDTAGEERYRSLTQGFFRNAQGIMVVYDVTKKETFDGLKKWIESIRNHLGSQNNSIPIITIGNKIDCQRRDVSKEDALKYSKELGYKYYETSAKTGEGVEETIIELAEEVLKKILENKKNGNYYGTNNYKAFKIETKKESKKKDESYSKCC